MNTSHTLEGLGPLPPLEHVPVAALRPHERNARKHSKKQIRLIATSIKEFGFINPVLVDANNRVIAGHGRLEAARQLGHSAVPALRMHHLSEAQLRAYVIADNRLAELAGWDQELLRLELGDLAELDYDLRLTGFETPEIDALLNPMLDDPEDLLEPDLNKPPVSRPGDLWILGGHRLLCADSTLAESYELLLAGQQAQLVFTDPPYNVPIEGNVTSSGRHGEFAMASGEMSPTQFTAFLRSIFVQLTTHSVDGSMHFVCMDWRHMREMLDASDALYELKNLCVWNKANAGMGSLYRSKHELIFAFKFGAAAHINNIELGKHGRHRSNVWNYAGATSMHKGRSQRLAMHPTVKPVSMICDAIQDCSHRDGLVLDPFGGSGSTLIAADKVGRRAALLELEPRYVDVTIRRYEQLGRGKVLHSASGTSFAELAEQRLHEEAAHG